MLNIACAAIIMHISGHGLVQWDSINVEFELLMLQVTANCRRQMLTDAIMLHLISHRPKEAVEKLQKMAAGDGVEIEAGASRCYKHSLQPSNTSQL